MKRMMKRLLPVLMAIAPLTICAQKVYELKDISGKVQVNVIVNDKNVEYSVLHDNDVMVAPSPIFMKLTDGTAFGLNPKVKKISRRSVNETIYPPIYKKKSIKDQFNELTIDFKGGYSLVFRAYEDGAAYRFVSELKKPFMVESEQASFCFPNDPKVFVASPKGRMNEGKNLSTVLSKIRIWKLPCLHGIRNRLPFYRFWSRERTEKKSVSLKPI